MESETTTEESYDYVGESVPTYGQTTSITQIKETKSPAEKSPEEKSTEDDRKQAQPHAKWKHHNLDSSLLEFLAFLAEHTVPVVGLEDVILDGAEFGMGTTMRVASGRWRGKGVAIKYPGQDVVKIGYTVEKQAVLKDRICSFKKLLKDLMFEIQIMRHPNIRKHPNIVELRAVAFEDSLVAPKLGDNHSQLGEKGMTYEIFYPVLFVEPAIKAYPDLSKYFKVHAGEQIPIEVAISLISDIAQGLAALHALGIVHGDVKDANILLFQDTVGETARITAKVADFGAAGIDASREDIRGLSRYWAAPEVLERPQGWEGLRRTPAADIYSFGILAATIAQNGKKVFEGSESYATKMSGVAAEHIKGLLDKITESRQNENSTEDLATFVKHMKVLVDRTVVLDPRKRLHNLSEIPMIFGKVPAKECVKSQDSIIPFHSYGTFAHMGIPPLAALVADIIYEQLPISIKHRLADLVRNFKNASKDSQTMLVHLALKMKEDPSVLESSDDLVRSLLALRLTRESPPETEIPDEADYENLGGFMQMYLKDIILGGAEEPPVLRAVRENNRVSLEDELSRDPMQRRATIGLNWNGLHYAAFFDRPELMDIFLQEPHQVSIEDVGGRAHEYTPLHIAAWEGNPNCVQYLIEHGANIDAKSMMAGDFSMTPMQLSVVGAQNYSNPKALETIRIFLEAGASTEFRFRGLGVAHYLAQRRGGAEALGLILQHKAHLATQLTPNKQTPLHSAAGSRNSLVVQLLLSLGVDADARNIVGDTPLHNAYMSIGPATRPTSYRYSEPFMRLLAGEREDAEKIISLLVEAGADEDAIGLDGIPWDTPEFRMYDEYEDASEVCISPWQEFGQSPGIFSTQWSFHEWPGSDFGHSSVFERGKDKLSLDFELGEITPNYYEVQIRLGCLDLSVQSASITVMVYREEGDTAEVYMASRVALHRLDINRVFEIKMRDFVVKHKKAFKIKVYEEATPGRGNLTAGPREGKLMLDWVKVSKFNIMTVVGSSTSASLDDFCPK